MRFDFMTLLVYSPRGTSSNAQFSRILAGACKNGESQFATQVALKIKELNAEDYFSNAALVPIPRSTPLVQGAVFPSKTLAETLLSNGLGNAMYPCLNRIVPINKSSSSFTAETRNTVPTHTNSLEVEPFIIPEPTIILIDDILTLGRTAIASSLKLQAIYPDKVIKIFCPFRTRSFADNNILVFLETGVIELSSDGNGARLPN